VFLIWFKTNHEQIHKSNTIAENCLVKMAVNQRKSQKSLVFL